MDSKLLVDAINLTLFGTGFVFVFLALMVVVTTLMSASVIRLQPNASLEGSGPVTDDGIDEEAEFIIREAIKMHRKN
jgi:oxaloacetate decarboxylase gamma subunit